uniref:Uncharacterized protein n=1 Tax=virus sp. ctBS918 TaxID=2825807 RepID=A0A8S5RP09_9VIRU|nr:MAG TPA: hypothetical protein [virus sp. ctBS918]DAI04316.1 MAG TPA: hypothetical protein [Caudoviricetes sp.]
MYHAREALVIPLTVAIRSNYIGISEGIPDIVFMVVCAILFYTSCQVKHSRSYLFSHNAPCR